MATEVDRDHAVPGREVLELRSKEPVVTAPTVDEDEGGITRARVLVVQRDAVSCQ
jgi:hypothetical protein